MSCHPRSQSWSERRVAAGRWPVDQPGSPGVIHAHWVSEPRGALKGGGAAGKCLACAAGREPPGSVHAATSPNIRLDLQASQV
ncbi:hypothetical protein SKAU_G00394160 [Synaphobranchus kaupii]|uniref:Uncharacterized protein n=1 Tax=Synaphobranchus kaupii TaxID=118154 RepID=A0A9Q1IBW3_SYNKA|nr:hypothetical protein SKAU_G00394160 [Synaphobranchus kaupii]